MRRLQEGIQRVISLIQEIPLGARLIRFIQANPLYKGVLILGSGTVVAQMIGILSMPIITRLYTPADLGVLAVYAAVLAIVAIGSSFSYYYAIVLPQKDDELANLIVLCSLLILITTISFSFILLFGSTYIAEIIDIEILEPYFWFLVIGFFGVGLYQLLNYWAIREREYKQITYTKINQGVGGSISKVLLGFLSFGPLGLIIGHIISQIAGIWTLGRSLLRKEKDILKKVSLGKIIYVAKEFRRFPLYNFPADIVNTLSLQLLPIMLLALYDAQVAGFYALANALLVLPSGVIATSVGQAYRGEAAKMIRERSQEFPVLYKRTIKHLFIISIPLFCIPALCAPFVFPIVFGEVWGEAGWYCLPLLALVIPKFISSPTSMIDTIASNYYLYMNFGRVLGVIAAFYISWIMNFGVLTTILIYSTTILSFYVFNIAVNYKLSITLVNKAN